jgi:hypothetical protein
MLISLFALKSITVLTFILALLRGSLVGPPDAFFDTKEHLHVGHGMAGTGLRVHPSAVDEHGVGRRMGLVLLPSQLDLPRADRSVRSLCSWSSWRSHTASGCVGG